MRNRFVPHLLTALVAVLALLPLGASAQAGDEYESTFGYVVSWSDEWSLEADFSLRTEGQLDLITLFSADGLSFVMITGFAANLIDPLDMITPDPADDVVDEDLDADVPYTVIDDSGARELSELYISDDGNVGIVVMLWAPANGFETRLATAQETIAIDGNAVLTGEPLGEPSNDESTSGRSTRSTSTDDDATEEATEQSTTGRSTRSTSTDEDATEEATEQSTSGRSTRSTSTDDDATEEATEQSTSGRSTRSTATEEATAESTSGSSRSTRTSSTASSDDGTIVGPIYDLTLQYDPEVWTITNSGDDGVSSMTQLQSDAGILTISEYAGYGADPEACLVGEADFYSESIADLEDMEIATRSNGDELTYTSDDLAWGVYTATYAGEPTVAYISCTVIPDEDAVLIVVLTASPEDYNTQLDLVLEVLDTLEFAN